MIGLEQEENRRDAKGGRKSSHRPAHVLGAFQYPKSKTNWRGHAQRHHVIAGAPVPAEAENPSCVEVADPGGPSHLALSPSLAR